MVWWLKGVRSEHCGFDTRHGPPPCDLEQVTLLRLPRPLRRKTETPCTGVSVSGQANGPTQTDVDSPSSTTKYTLKTEVLNPTL
jgi:hypothetical protein